MRNLSLEVAQELVDLAVDRFDESPELLFEQWSTARTPPKRLDKKKCLALIAHAQDNYHLDPDDIIDSFSSQPGSGSRKVRTLTNWLTALATFAAKVSGTRSAWDTDSGGFISTYVHPVIAEFRNKHFGDPDKILTVEGAVEWLRSQNADLEQAPRLPVGHAILSSKAPPFLLNPRIQSHQELAQAANTLCRPDGLAALEDTARPERFRWTPEEAIGHILCGLVPRIDPVETYVIRDYFAPGLDAVVVVASPHEEVRNLSDAWRSAADIRLGRRKARAERDLIKESDELRTLAASTYAEPPEELEAECPGIRKQYAGMRKYFEEKADKLVAQSKTTFPEKMPFRTEQVLRLIQRTPHWSRPEQLAAINREFPPELRYKNMNTFEVAIFTARKNKLGLPKADWQFSHTVQAKTTAPYVELEQWWQNPSEVTRIIIEMNGDYPREGFRRVQME